MVFFLVIKNHHQTQKKEIAFTTSIKYIFLDISMKYF